MDMTYYHTHDAYSELYIDQYELRLLLCIYYSLMHLLYGMTFFKMLNNLINKCAIWQKTMINKMPYFGNSRHRFWGDVQISLRNCVTI